MSQKRVKRDDLRGLKLTREVCLLGLDEDGTIILKHVEATVVWADEDGGYSDTVFGDIVFNGEVRLPVQFRWAWVSGDAALAEQRRRG